MDSFFNLHELCDTVEGQLDDVMIKQHASGSSAVDEPEPFFPGTNEASSPFPIVSIDLEFAGELSTENVESNEVIGDVNSTAGLNYMRQLLLEEETNEKLSTEEEWSLLVTERVFNDILRQEYYTAPDELQVHEPTNQITSVNYCNHKKINDGGKKESRERGFGDDLHYVKPPSVTNDVTLSLPLESPTVEQIQKGIDEAMKFLPNIGEFFNNRKTNGSISDRDCSLRIKKNPNYSDMYQLEGRALKLVAYSDEPIRNENFDKILLVYGKKFIEEDTMIRKTMQLKLRDQSRKSQLNYSIEQDNNQMVEETINLRYLLINCSLAISANDHSLAKELIYKIRKCSSPTGEWSQRLAYYIVDGLEARLAGTGIDIYSKLLPEQLTFLERLKAYRMYLAASPCRRAIVSFANKTILKNISRHTQKVHIINYGIKLWFQWPSFFEYFANWEGTAPKIRITVIEVPEPGFRPRRKVDLIGQRLADYAKSFNVPFEYEGIVSKWENVKVEDMKISNDEVVIVSSIFHSEKLSDESLGTDSPRDVFLNTIRKINPRIFIHVTSNGSYNSPIFPARFRDVLSFYSSVFEMLDSNMPRDNPERLTIERNYFMPEAINAIAFEGPDRVERPETYWHWHARKLRAGLVPLPVDPMIKNNIKEFVQEHYHKDFFIGDDNGWLLLGWKGRIWYGLTTWKAKEA